MDQLIALEPKEWKHVMRKALALLKLGREAEAMKLSRDITSRGRPQSDGDSYYRGMAFYLLGNLDQAEQHFRDSKRGEEWRYSMLTTFSS
jgi:tetratricopeptide (TPR) repeat protein